VSVDELVNLAGPGDLHPVDQIALLVAAGLDARRACPQAAAAGEKVLDESCERLERRDDGALDSALSHQIDGRTGQEHRDAKPGGHAAIADREGDRGQLVVCAVGDKDDKIA
jgi:hypothetical protein